jgi:hypothetical protein
MSCIKDIEGETGEAIGVEGNSSRDRAGTSSEGGRGNDGKTWVVEPKGCCES